MSQLSWLNDCFLSATSSAEMTKNLYLIMSQVKTQPAEFAAEFLEHLKTTCILDHLSQRKNEEFRICAVQCIDETLNALCDTELTVSQLEVFEAIGKAVLLLHYSPDTQLVSTKNNTLFLLASLSLLSKITSRCPNFATPTHVSKVLGIAKANVCFGLETVKLIIPQTILPLQNLSYDSSTEELECENLEIETNMRRSRGGKVPKKRKPRALAKSIQKNNLNQQQQQSIRFQSVTFDQIMIASDSDTSEFENNAGDGRFLYTHRAYERQKHSKVRQMSISLLGTVVTRLQERRLLYGYWYAFFENTKIPAEEGKSRHRSDLLFIALNDPNSRCRATALQIAGQLIFSSKNFLQKAECVVRRLPLAFLPFGHSLGLQVVSMFEELTLILAKESSILVLTQALKCLAVLIQATTPFHKFQPKLFVQEFVKEVQRLLTHHDETIQVAAFMVFEFLITATELTPEVLNAIGSSHLNSNDQEEHLREENIEKNNNGSDKHLNSCNIIPKMLKTNWLLERVLQNLYVYSAEGTRNNSTNSVKIECLQVLAAMAQHFSLLQSHLNSVAVAIENALLDSQADLRFCAARCLDTIAYQISRVLSENSIEKHDITSSTKSNSGTLEEVCLSFWNKILPTIMDQIRLSTSDINPAFVKVCLCDVLSNIGMIIFERQSYAVQMKLIGFLSGISCDSDEDVSVRCAAVRAISVYVLFPSLRGNLVFVENAAELALRLISDTNILIRVKASWALGNISDALLISKNDTADNVQFPERISEELLWRFVSAATEACNDNDKVRCNAVRTLGNLLRLLEPVHFNIDKKGRNDNIVLFQNAIMKLLDCLRSNFSAKVKWNTCYAIGNLLQNPTLFALGRTNNFDWQSKLFFSLTDVITQHPNFKVRINAATALTRVTTRAHFDVLYEMVWKALLKAIEMSHHLDNFYEYNHRDGLQEQLCLAVSHLLRLAQMDDFILLNKHLEECTEIVRNTWIRVINRMVPEKSAPLVGCAALLRQLKNSNMKTTVEQRNAIDSIIKIFEIQ